MRINELKELASEVKHWKDLCLQRERELDAYKNGDLAKGMSIIELD